MMERSDVSDASAEALGAIPADVLQSTQPVLLRGLVKHWPLVQVWVELQFWTVCSTQLPPPQRLSTTWVLPLHLRDEQTIPSLMAIDTQTGEPVSQEILPARHMLLVPQVPPGTQAVTHLPPVHM